MKYIKKYNENIVWDFDEEEQEEIIYNGTIIKYPHSDRYSYLINEQNYRYLLANTDNIEKDLLYDIVENKPVFNDGSNIYKEGTIISKHEYKEIKNEDVWITNNYPDFSPTFRKWRLSELENIFNIKQ